MTNKKIVFYAERYKDDKWEKIGYPKTKKHALKLKALYSKNWKYKMRIVSVTTETIETEKVVEE